MPRDCARLRFCNNGLTIFKEHHHFFIPHTFSSQRFFCNCALLSFFQDTLSFVLQSFCAARLLSAFAESEQQKVYGFSFSTRHRQNDFNYFQWHS